MPSPKILKLTTAPLALLITVIALFLCQQSWIITILARQSPEVVYSVETQEPVVALTIDDGPDPVSTSKILDRLRQYDAQATFFLITSHIPGNEAVIDRIVQENNEIGNHLMIDGASIMLASDEFERQLVETHQSLSRFSEVRWFRPGKGRYDAEMLSIARKHNYQIALGSVYPFDPHIPSSWFAARHILWNVQPGSIIILHDNGGRGERTAATLATILPELRWRGYRIVTLSELVDLYSEDGQNN